MSSFFSHLLNTYEPYTMTEQQFFDLEGKSSTELAEYDLQRIDEQIKNTKSKPDDAYYNKDILSRIANRAYMECVRDNGASKCTRTGKTATAGALSVAEKISALNGQATCNDTYNLYKQHLDNILNIRFGGVPSSEFVNSDSNCDAVEGCLDPKCLAQPICIANNGACAKLPDLSYYANGGKIGSLSKNDLLKPVIVQPSPTKPVEIKTVSKLDPVPTISINQDLTSLTNKPQQVESQLSSINTDINQSKSQSEEPVDNTDDSATVVVNEGEQQEYTEEDAQRMEELIQEAEQNGETAGEEIIIEGSADASDDMKTFWMEGLGINEEQYNQITAKVKELNSAGASDDEAMQQAVMEVLNISEEEYGKLMTEGANPKPEEEEQSEEPEPVSETEPTAEPTEPTNPEPQPEEEPEPKTQTDEDVIKPDEPAKSKAWIYILITFIVLATVGAAVYFFILKSKQNDKNENTPTSTV